MIHDYFSVFSSWLSLNSICARIRRFGGVLEVSMGHFGVIPLSKHRVEPAEPEFLKEKEKWSCSGHSCHRLVQALAHILCLAPSMGPWDRFCLILHTHHVAVPFPPTFASPWRNSVDQIHGEQLCSRQNSEPPLRNDPKTTQIWGWGHLGAQQAQGL